MFLLRLSFVRSVRYHVVMFNSVRFVFVLKIWFVTLFPLGAMCRLRCINGNCRVSLSFACVCVSVYNWLDFHVYSFVISACFKNSLINDFFFLELYHKFVYYALYGYIVIEVCLFMVGLVRAHFPCLALSGCDISLGSLSKVPMNQEIIMSNIFHIAYNRDEKLIRN